MKHPLFAFGLALTLTAAAGCEARKPVVSGLVTLDGQPLDNGTIQFFPVAGDGQTAAALIGKDGRYRTEASPTKMKVVIRSTRVVGQRKMYDDQPDGPTVDIVEDVLPARYSDMNRTELTFTVVPGDNQADFELRSDQKQ